MKKFLGVILSMAMLLSIVSVGLTTSAVVQTVYTVKSDFENQNVAPWGNPYGTAPTVSAGAAKNGSYGLESAGRFQANFAAGEGAGKIQPGVMNDIRFWARTAEGTSGLEVQVYYNLSKGGANSLRVSMGELYSIGSDWTDVRMNFNLFINEQNELVAVWRRPDMTENATQVLTTVAAGAYITSFDVLVLTTCTAYFDDFTISSAQDIPVYENVYACNEDFEDQATAWAGAFGGTATIDATAAKNGSYGLKANSRIQTNFAAGVGEGKILPGVMNTMEFSMKANAGVTNGFYVLMYVNGTSGLLFDGLQLSNGSSPLNGDNWVDFSLEFCLYINDANQLYAKWRRTDMTGYTEQPLTGALAAGTEITSFDIVFVGLPEVCVDDIKIYSQQEVIAEEYIVNNGFDAGNSDGWHSSGMSIHDVINVGGDFGNVVKATQIAGAPQNRFQTTFVPGTGANALRDGEVVDIQFDTMAPTGGSYYVYFYFNCDTIGGRDALIGENCAFTADGYSRFKASVKYWIEGNTLYVDIVRHGGVVLKSAVLATNVNSVNSIDFLIMSNAPVFYIDNFKMGYHLKNVALGADAGVDPTITKDPYSFSVEAEAGAPVNTKAPTGYFVPYGGVYYETADGIEYVEKNEDGSFTAPVAGEYKVISFALPGEEGVTTFAASAKIGDTQTGAIQYSSYVPAVANKKYGTMFMSGDWDAFVTYYTATKGWTVDQIIEKISAMYDANIGSGKNVAISAGADIVIYVYKLDQQRYMYKNDTVLQYALRVSNLPKDKVVSAVGYAKDDAGVSFSENIVSVSYNELVK